MEPEAHSLRHTQRLIDFLSEKENKLTYDMRKRINVRSYWYLFNETDEEHRSLTTMMGENMGLTERLLKFLLEKENKLPHQFRRKIDSCCKEFMDTYMVIEAAEFISEDLDSDRHTEQEVETILDIFPRALLCGAPIHRIFSSARENANAKSFLPLLVERGERVGVGLREGNCVARGGLLLNGLKLGDENCNTLQYLVNCFGDGNDGDDSGYGDNDDNDDNDDDDDQHSEVWRILDKLREKDLLFVNDIRKQNLLYPLCCTPARREGFEYFLKWDPTLLSNYKDHYSLVRYMVHRGDASIFSDANFEMALQAQLEHFPNSLGLLFREEPINVVNRRVCFTTFEYAINRCPTSALCLQVWNSILKCLTNNPEHNKIFQRDPETNTYPFFAAAVAGDRHSDSSLYKPLDMLYYMLRKEPAVLKRDSEEDTYTPLPLSLPLPLPVQLDNEPYGKRKEVDIPQSPEVQVCINNVGEKKRKVQG